MIGAWTINVSGRLYGPFTSDRMRSFAREGRLAAHSLVTREGTLDWHEARDEPEFADLFYPPSKDNAVSGHETLPSPGASAAPESPEPSPKPFTPYGGTAMGGAMRTMAQRSGGPLSASPSPSEGADGTKSHFAIVADLKSGSASNLEEAIATLGPAYRLTPNVWIVSAEHSVNAVRNRLVQELGKLDSLFVIDASHGKAAWFNFGPEVDVRIRRVWRKAS
jgi:hypothetical protein